MNDQTAHTAPSSTPRQALLALVIVGALLRLLACETSPIGAQESALLTCIYSDWPHLWANCANLDVMPLNAIMWRPLACLTANIWVWRALCVLMGVWGIKLAYALGERLHHREGHTLGLMAAAVSALCFPLWTQEAQAGPNAMLSLVTMLGLLMMLELAQQRTAPPQESRQIRPRGGWGAFLLTFFLLANLTACGALIALGCACTCLGLGRFTRFKALICQTLALLPAALWGLISIWLNAHVSRPVASATAGSSLWNFPSLIAGLQGLRTTAQGVMERQAFSGGLDMGMLIPMEVLISAFLWIVAILGLLFFSRQDKFSASLLAGVIFLPALVLSLASWMGSIHPTGSSLLTLSVPFALAVFNGLVNRKVYYMTLGITLSLNLLLTFTLLS